MRRTVLLVGEDLRHSPSGLTEALGEDFQVVGPLTALEALRWLGREAAEATIVSATLADLTPSEFATVLRQRPRTRTSPLVLMALGRRHEDPELNGYDVTVASTEPAEAACQIRAVVRRQRASFGLFRSGAYEGTTLKADFGAFSIEAGGMRVDLTRRELQLLEYLVNHRDRVVGREELVRTVWRSAVHLDSHTVEHHIGRLRRQLAGAGQVIHTIVGVGYRFREPDDVPR